MDNYGPIGSEPYRMRFGQHRNQDLRLLPVGYHAWCLENHRYGYTSEQVECITHFMGGALVTASQARQIIDTQHTPTCAAEVVLHVFMTWWMAMQSEIRNAHILYGVHRPLHSADSLDMHPTTAGTDDPGDQPDERYHDIQRERQIRQHRRRSPDPEPTKLMASLVEWYDELSKYFDPMLHLGDHRPLHIVDLARDKMYEVLKKNNLIVEEEVEQVNRRSIQI